MSLADVALTRRRLAESAHTGHWSGRDGRRQNELELGSRKRHASWVDDRDPSSLNLRLACSGGGVIDFGPLTRDLSTDSFDFIAGPIQVLSLEGEVLTLVDRNGMEALALSHFRGDLLLMLANEMASSTSAITTSRRSLNSKSFVPGL